jgi:hypothetical protein
MTPRRTTQGLTGTQAAQARQKKFAALREFHLPREGLAGSLTLTHRRCGKASCRCAKEGEPGHPQWLLTFMVDGKKRVEAIPADWVEEVQSKVRAGQAAKQALTDLLAANAELLSLERKERAHQRKKRK